MIGSNADAGISEAAAAPAIDPANAKPISGRNVPGSGRTRR